MMVIRLIVAIPLLLIGVLFALSNREPVKLGLWPTDYAIQVPVSIAILVAMAVAFFFGGIVLWINVLGARGRARSAERARERLQAEVATLRTDLAAAQSRAERSATRQPALIDHRG